LNSGPPLLANYHRLPSLPLATLDKALATLSIPFPSHCSPTRSDLRAFLKSSSSSPGTTA
jgi:hypothetical protein